MKRLKVEKDQRTLLRGVFTISLLLLSLSIVMCSKNNPASPPGSPHLEAFAGGDQYRDIGTSVTLNGSGSGGNVQSYQWQRIYQLGQSSAPASGNGVTLAFTLDEPDSLEYELIVSDGTSSDKDTCMIRSNAPTITSINPTSGPAGTSVAINGTNFSPTNGRNEVYFNADQATVTGNSITQVTANVPVGASTGPVSLTVLGTNDAVTGPTFTVSASTAGSWVLKESGLGCGLWGLSFPSTNVGVTVSCDGKVVRTEDGGDTWTVQTNTGVSAQLRDVWFTSELIGTAVGANATLIRTIDGGVTWTSPAHNAGAYLYGICYVNNTGWVYGNLTNSRTIIIKTYDDGATWTSPDTLHDYSTEGIYFVDTDHGWICGSDQAGNPGILRTVDGGATWLPAQTIPAGNFAGELFFVDVETGWGVGDKSGGGTSVIHTTDSGKTWVDQSQNLPPGAMNYAYDVYFLNDQIGAVVGTGGFIYRTEDGGVTWVAEEEQGANLHAIVLTDAVGGIVVGSVYSPTGNGFISRRE